MPVVVTVIMGMMVLSTVAVIAWSWFYSREQNRQVFVYVDNSGNGSMGSSRTEKFAGKTVVEARQLLGYHASKYNARLLGEKDNAEEDYTLQRYDGIIFTIIKQTTNPAAGCPGGRISVNANSITAGWLTTNKIPSTPTPSYHYTWHKSPQEQSREPESAMGYVYGLRSFYPSASGRQYLQGGYQGRWYSPRQNGRCIPKAAQDRHASWSFRQEHEVPHPYPCKCGINMYHIPGNLQAIAQRMSQIVTPSSFQKNIAIVALTRGWGRVVEHEYGYRVQKALVTHVFLPTTMHYLPDAWIRYNVKRFWDVGEFAKVCISEQKKNALVAIPENER